MKTLLLFGCILIVVSLLTVASTTARELEVGTPFPDVKLPSLEEGRALSVRDFRGKKLVLHIWASW